MKMRRTILVTLCFFVSNVASSQAVDFFPLAVGTRWTYSFRTLIDQAIGDVLTGDTGTAQYLVLGQVSYPDSVIWHFRETRVLIHSSSHLFNHANDETYSIIDTSKFDLVEYTSGLHRLVKVKTSYSPFYESVFAFLEDFPDSLVVYRYANNPASDSLVFSGNNPYVHVVMTLLRNVGLANLSMTPTISSIWTIANHSLTELTAVSSKLSKSQEPDHLTLHTYPNPFNSVATVSYFLPIQGHTRVRILDVLGRTVAFLVDEIESPGEHRVAWNAIAAASGPYFCSIEFNGKIKTIGLLLVK